MNVDQVPVSRAGDEASCKDEVSQNASFPHFEDVKDANSPMNHEYCSKGYSNSCNDSRKPDGKTQPSDYGNDSKDSHDNCNEGPLRVQDEDRKINVAPTVSQELAEQLKPGSPTRRGQKARSPVDLCRGSDAVDSIFRDTLELCEKMKTQAQERDQEFLRGAVNVIEESHQRL